MKKIIALIFILTFTASVAIAQEGATVPAVINSRIFSTQNAAPLESLERTQYTNRSINRLETKNVMTTREEIQNRQDPLPSEKESKGGIFKGFKVIW